MATRRNITPTKDVANRCATRSRHAVVRGPLSTGCESELQSVPGTAVTERSQLQSEHNCRPVGASQQAAKHTAAIERYPSDLYLEAAPCTAPCTEARKLKRSRSRGCQRIKAQEARRQRRPANSPNKAHTYDGEAQCSGGRDEGHGCEKSPSHTLRDLEKAI